MTTQSTPTPLHIPHSDNSPEVRYHPQGHVFSMSGSCFPSNSIELFQPIHDWLADNQQALSARTLTVVIAINYMNTSSSKQLILLAENLNQFTQQGDFDYHVVWIYELDDEDVEDAGKDFAVLTGARVSVICMNKELL